jgi:DNA-binding NtrC family response regulator
MSGKDAGMDAMVQRDHHPPPPWEVSRSADTTVEHARNAGHQRRRPSVAEAGAGSKGCVLLVDDDSAIRDTLSELLEDVGFRLVQAADAAQALIALRQVETIDVLVTDLTMPGEDGIALIRRARAMRHDLPAILLTGYAEQVTAITTIAGGNFHVLRKPVESGRLIQQLELLVARASL